MDLISCVPRDKHDLAAVNKARLLGYPVINEVLPDLLAWVQDANWPVARNTADLLSQSGAEIVPPIRQILRSDDAVWKFWVIELIVRHLAPDVRLMLTADLETLSQTSNAFDKLEGVDRLAKEVLAL